MGPAPAGDPEGAPMHGRIIFLNGTSSSGKSSKAVPCRLLGG